MSAASGGNSEPKQGQRSQSARGFCPRSTMRVPQPDIIEHFGNADAVPQLPERCLSRKAGIVRYCPNCGLQKRAPHAVRHLFVAVIASIISYASRVSTDILTNIMQASLRCCSRFFSAAFPSHPSSLHPDIPAHVPSFSPIIPRAIPHNSKCRYGERGAVAARPKAQIILDVLSSILATQMPCRSCRSGA